MQDIIVVGAGFAGLACARTAARRGLAVTVIDRKPVCGARMHTTGILVKEAAEEWELPARLTRKIHGVRLYTPSLAHVDLASPGYYFLATETASVMRWLAREAQQAGARIALRRPYRGALREPDRVRLPDHDLAARVLVGADGPTSAVARDCGLDTNTRFLAGVEWEMADVGGVAADRLHCFVDAELAPGYIGWALQGVHGITQVGLAAHVPVRPDLERFRVKLLRLFDFSAARVLEKRSGLIPVGGRLARFHDGNVLLIGDAAGLVSPLTAGGIHAALDSGHRAGHAIADWLHDHGHAPGPVLERVLPTFRAKGLLRRAADLGIGNRTFDLLLAHPATRAVAQWLFFHKRGPFSRDAWRDLATMGSGTKFN